MKESKFPKGWDEARVKKLLEHYQSLTEDEQVAEDEEAVADNGHQTVIAIPSDLLPAVRKLLAERNKSE